MDCCDDPTPMCRVVCPKPRRVAPSNVNSLSMAPSRFHIRNDAESNGAELLGQILRKDEFKAERCTSTTLSSSPPFFFGSPPCRTPNPVVQDAHFGVEELTYICKVPTDSASQRSAHAREQLGKKQAAVRVEGFDLQSSHAIAMA